MKCVTTFYHQSSLLYTLPQGSTFTIGEGTTVYILGQLAEDIYANDMHKYHVTNLETGQTEKLVTGTVVKPADYLLVEERLWRECLRECQRESLKH